MDSRLPSKVLRIHEITFALPDDFDGTASDAFDAFIAYRNEHKDDAILLDNRANLTSVELLAKHPNVRVCGDIILFELGPDGKYNVIDGSFINDEVIPLNFN